MTPPKQLAVLPSVPTALAALEHAFSERGASALDPRVPDAVWWRALAGPAEDFLSRSGKELRTALVRAGCMLGGARDGGLPERLALVVELLHAGSLVIDDVEDGSKERRGAPALHHVYGVPLAINTGSWMYFWALAEIENLGLPPACELALHRSACTTLVRCHQGQALDLAVKISDLALTDVPNVVAATTRLKTGTLCGFATSLGAHAVAAPSSIVHATTAFGTAAGTALQMLDDLGSLTSRARRDKGREDLRGERPTWPWAWLAETRPFMWSRLVAQAHAAREDDELDAVADALAAEVGEVGRERIRALLDDTLADLSSHAGSGPALATIGAALSQMEKSYG
jgi:geranylgeranyl pyrophosphate synthase